MPRGKRKTTEDMELRTYARLGAVEEVTRLLQKVRLIETIFPGITEAARKKLVAEQMARARAARAAAPARNGKTDRAD